MINRPRALSAPYDSITKPLITFKKKKKTYYTLLLCNLISSSLIGFFHLSALLLFHLFWSIYEMNRKRFKGTKSTVRQYHAKVVG
ncbi:hypothetical protein GYMLUDRAFT_830180 [Collybiopsis luxurians FD-317 M1]|uniref:Uncharacterized protein n=1 Tax=Collybiopsis luxurians FD-317 M1 TaxID=944289 RepID=A0A0D0CL57_9AGAR|nr:hypothetical protein GYMLUDRAFT_830180 [Collybiopsis luxurians FD-317 M1]